MSSGSSLLLAGAKDGPIGFLGLLAKKKGSKEPHIDLV